MQKVFRNKVNNHKNFKTSSSKIVTENKCTTNTSYIWGSYHLITNHTTHVLLGTTSIVLLQFQNKQKMIYISTYNNQFEKNAY